MNKNKDKKTKTPKEDRYRQRLKEEIFSFFDINFDHAFSLNNLYQHFGIKDRNVRLMFEELVNELATEARLSCLADGTYQVDNELSYLTGKVEHVNARFAFVVPAEVSGEDIYVETNHLNGAIDGDLVKVALWSSKSKKQRAEGEVVEIIQRNRPEIVGTVQLSPRFAYVLPDSRRLYQDIFVSKNDLNGAQDGDKVIVKITNWGEQNGLKTTGKVIEVLGKAGNNHTEMHAILAEFGLPNRFAEQIIQEAQDIADQITASEISQRRDFRPILTFTIDPEDAKDFDDALSLRYLDNGNYEVGIHIADVTHYVKPNTELDKEALRRGTSVYLVDRVVPMLPEKLSNNLCSLRPHEDKLTFSAVFEVRPDASIANQWFGRTVIHSDKRLSYEDAQAILEMPSPHSDFDEALWLLNDLAKRLKAERFRHGAINFETVEVKFRLDENGVPVSVYQKVRKDAHKLIEEFMLLANRKVAEFVYLMHASEPKNTMVYRVHEAPNFEKLNSFVNFAKRFGYDLRLNENNVSSTLNYLMSHIEGRPEQNVLESLAIRAMAKARYSTEALGHFGLAFAHYTHFTSPIRRYPDMMVHRLLQHYLTGGKSVDANEYEALCRHSSDRERLAAEAERASIKYKQVEFMSKMNPQQVFDGIVTGVTEFGVFVEITETACEGMVRMADLKDDFYEFDKENLRIVGKRSGRVITFGDAVQVKVKETNLARRSMDLSLVAYRSASGQMKALNNKATSAQRKRNGAIHKGKRRSKR